MKINMKNRYAVDYAAYEPDGIKMNLSRNTGLEQVPTETLRNIWMARFGDRAVTMRDMHSYRLEEIADVGQELANRKQIRFETQGFVDRAEVTHYYILEKEIADH